MSGPRGLLIDLDDTLYDYLPAERRGRAAALMEVARDLGVIEASALEGLYDEARARVKERVATRGSSHSRLLYFCELAHMMAAPSAARAGEALASMPHVAIGPCVPLARVRAWERTFWTEYLRGLTLRDGARDLLVRFRASGGRVAIVTDLVLEVQLWKLEALGLAPLMDALAVSEEVEHDKPARGIFDLAASRLGVSLTDCVMIGDDPRKDGQGAAAVGVPYFQAQSSERAGGLPLAAIADMIGV